MSNHARKVSGVFSVAKGGVPRKPSTQRAFSVAASTAFGAAILSTTQIAGKLGLSQSRVAQLANPFHEDTLSLARLFQLATVAPRVARQIAEAVIAVCDANEQQRVSA